MNEYAVIFDMDGVIADTNPYHVKAFQTFFDKHRVPYALADFDEHMYGKHNSYIMRHFFEREIGDEEFVQLELEKEALFREIYKREAKAIAGFEDFLAALRDKGFKTAVATSAPKSNLDLIIDTIGIRAQMDSILTSEDVTKHKPDPQVYLKTAKNLGVPAERCLVFEDSFSGVTAALNAGMRVVGVLTTHTKEQLPPCDLYIVDYRSISADDVRNLLNG